MLNYIKSELYRISHKKGTYIYYGTLIGLFLILMIFSSVDLTPSMYLSNLIYNFFPMVGLFVSLQVFISVYGDDVSSKSLSISVSSGLSKTEILVGKIIVSLIALIVIFAVLGMVAMGYYIILGGRFAPNGLEISETELFQQLLGYCGVSIVYYVALMSLSGVVLYMTQSLLISIIIYVLIFSGLFSGIIYGITAIFKINDIVMPLLLSSFYQKTVAMSFNNFASITTEPFIGMVSYVIICGGLSTLILNTVDIKN